MSRILIVLDPDPGEMVNDVAAKAIRLANDPAIHALTPYALPRIQFTHNDALVHVYPEDTVDTVYARWEDARNKLRGARP